MQVKSTVIHHLTPVKMSIIKKKHPKMTNIEEDMGKREFLGTIGGNINWFSHYVKQ